MTSPVAIQLKDTPATSGDLVFKDPATGGGGGASVTITGSFAPLGVAITAAGLTNAAVTGTFAPLGVSITAVGLDTATITGAFQPVSVSVNGTYFLLTSPGAIPPGDFGSLSLSRTIRGTGFTGAMGSVVAYNYRQYVLASGVAAAGIGAPSVSPFYVRPTGFVGALGTATLTQTLTTRSLTTQGIGPGSVGTASVVGPRTLSVFGFNSALYGGINVSRNPSPAGIVPGDFGTARVDDGKQYAAPAGIAAPEIPVPAIEGLWQFVTVPSLVEAGIFGDVSARLQRRYVSPYGFGSSTFANYAPLVLNRNSVVLPYGFASHQFGASADVQNAARVIAPFYTSSGETFGPDTGVAGPIQYAYPVELVPPDPAFGMAEVRNYTSVVSPAGYDALLPGNAVVDFRIRSLAPLGSVQTTFGVSTVEFRTKTLALSGIASALYGANIVEFFHRTYSFAGFDSALYGTSAVSLYDRPVSPAGFVGTLFGASTNLSLKNRPVVLSGFVDGELGTPTAATVNRAIALEGFSDEALGEGASVELFDRSLALSGIGPEAYGSTVVEFRSRFATALGFANDAYGTPSLSPRYLSTTGFASSVIGTDASFAFFDKTVAPSGFDAAAYGVAGSVGLVYRDVTAIGIDGSGYGTSASVVLKNRRIRVSSVEDDTYGTPDVSPQFVLVADTAPGAVGGVSFSQTLTTRSLSLSGFASFGLGAPFLTQQQVAFTQYVVTRGFPTTGRDARFGSLFVTRNPSPVGIPPCDFGIPRVDDGKQYVAATGIAALAESVPDVKGFWEYVSPLSVAEAGVFGDVRLTLGRRVVGAIGWDSTLFPSYQPQIVNKTQQLLPFGWVEPGPLYARPAVRNTAWQIFPVANVGPEIFGSEIGVGAYVRYVTPYVVGGEAFGTFTTNNLTRLLSVDGFEGAFGEASITTKVRFVSALGFKKDGYGADVVVEFRDRTFGPIGGFNSAQYGVARVEGFIRDIYNVVSIAPPAAGTPLVQFFRRELTPVGIGFFPQNSQFGFVKTEFRTKQVSVPGIGTPGFGTLQAARNEVVVYPPSIIGAISTPDIQHKTRYLLNVRLGVQTRYSEEHNVTISPRYVTQYIDDAEKPFYGGVGTALVENSLVPVRTYGHRSSRFGTGVYVYNNARIVAATGTDTSRFGSTLVADRIRYVTPLTYGTSSLVSRWTEVRNYRQILEPTGIPRLLAGVPRVWSNTQYVELYGSNNLHTRYGTAMVADAIREITFTVPGSSINYSIPPGVVGSHYTGLYSRFVSPPGLEGEVGQAVVEHTRTVFRPFGTDYSVFGEVGVRNKTPELKAGSMDTPLMPSPWVSHSPRTLDTTQYSIVPTPQFIPRPDVSFRTKVVVPGGFDALKIPLLHRVWIDIPYIQLPTIVTPYGIGLPMLDPNDEGHTVQGSPFIEGFDSAKYGRPTVRIQGCTPFWEEPYSDFHFGRPDVVQSPRSMTVAAWTNANTTGEGGNLFGKPQLSPHTVWAAVAPQQAISNHDGIEWEDVDTSDTMAEQGSKREPGPGPIWGNANVAHRNRTVYQFHSQQPPATTVGEKIPNTAVVRLKRRYIYPVGIVPKRVGFPELPFIGDLLMQPWESSTVSKLAEVTIGPPPPSTVTIYPVGLTDTDYGPTKVELFIRYLTPQGFSPAVFGNNNPMVHFPRRFAMSGTDTSLYGTPAVTDYIRYIFPEGLDSLEMDDSPGFFSSQLRVAHKTNPLPLPGFAAGAFGTTGVRNATLRVYPYQIANPRCLGHDITVTRGP